MSILIFSLPGDDHSLAVKYAIERKGVSASLLCWSDFPQLCKVSATFAPSAAARFHCDLAHSGCIDIASVTAFWNHRKAPPTPHPEISRSDHSAISISADVFLGALVSELENTAFVVNPSESKRRFDNKITQLAIAQDCGLRIPRTLVSNDYDEVRAFCDAVGKCIIKPLKYMKWNLGEIDADLKTTRIGSVANVNPVSIEACPMIYQEEVRKAHEYRVVVFGREIRAFRLDSQRHRASALDWRAIDHRKLGVYPDSVDERTQECLLAFMSKCGFVSGSFDLAVDRAGEIVFFEFNETGQFLWLEEICPDAALLDIFAQFLIEADPEFKYAAQGDVVRFDRFRMDAAVDSTRASGEHVQANLDKRFKEFELENVQTRVVKSRRRRP